MYNLRWGVEGAVSRESRSWRGPGVRRTRLVPHRSLWRVRDSPGSNLAEDMPDRTPGAGRTPACEGGDGPGGLGWSSGRSRGWSGG